MARRWRSPAPAPAPIRCCSTACPWRWMRRLPPATSSSIHPTRDAIEGFAVAITDPGKIAAAAPIRASAASANTGTGTYQRGRGARCRATPQLLGTVNIVFTSATTYSVNGGADIAYTAGSDIDVNGWRSADQWRARDWRQLHGAQQRGRRGRQPQCLRARRRHEGRRARERHGLGVLGRRTAHRQRRRADARARR